MADIGFVVYAFVIVTHLIIHSTKLTLIVFTIVHAPFCRFLFGKKVMTTAGTTQPDAG